MAGDNRTEKPTGKRRQEARKKGQVAHSMEISSVVVLFAGMMLLSSRAPELLGQYAAVTREAFLHLAVRNERPEAVLSLSMSLLASSALVLAPVVLGVAVAGTAIGVVQVGPMFSTEVLKPNLAKLNPLMGLQRMWSPRIFMELFKSATKLSVVGFVAYQVIRERYGMLVGLQAASAEGALGVLGGIMMEIAQKCGIALLIMAVADYIYQRRSHESSLKMTKEEIKEEGKQAEGNPQVKGKIRSLQRQMARSRMMQAVPHADVVVTNPTHYAIALEYKPPRMQAPVVVAKGQNLVAERIKRVAKEHGVPVVENPPLARALHASVEIGDAIPPAMYQAVAEVLAFIYRLRGSED
ncbi:MAG: flagellar biosynthesis protein FlhB [Chloroflexota bacterium]